MSELNVYHHELRPGEYDEFYLKYEADKVIAELNRQIAFLKVTTGSCKDCSRCADGMGKVFNKEFDQLKDKLRYQKYKRCLAMANWCERKRIDAANYRIPRKKWEFYDKWYKRWLKISEQFKEEK